jgi:hypothetical protein
MKQLIILLFSIFSLVACHPKPGNPETLMVGTSYRSITPEPGAFIAGDQNNRKFTGVHDSLYVKALVVSDTKNMVTILSFDCIGMLYPTLLEIRKSISEKIPIADFDPACIVMASTHTHSGPDVVGIWGPDQMTSGVNPDYLKEIVLLSTEAIVSAWKNRQLAKAIYAQTSFGEDWVYNIADSLNLDRSLTVLQFLDQNDQSIATLNNFACHPTIMDGVSSEVSTDYVSAMYSCLDDRLGGVNFFLQGAIGGWIQPEYEPKTFESVEKRGRDLGMAILTALNNPKDLNSNGIQFKSRVFYLPVSNENFKLLSDMGVIDRPMTDSVKTEVAWFSIGNAQFVTHPGETTPDHSLESKKMMKVQGPKFVIGLGMDALGYILTPKFYQPNPEVRHSEYLTGMSVDQEAGKFLMDQIISLATGD